MIHGDVTIAEHGTLRRKKFHGANSVDYIQKIARGAGFKSYTAMRRTADGVGWETMWSVENGGMQSVLTDEESKLLELLRAVKTARAELDKHNAEWDKAKAELDKAKEAMERAGFTQNDAGDRHFEAKNALKAHVNDII